MLFTNQGKIQGKMKQRRIRQMKIKQAHLEAVYNNSDRIYYQTKKFNERKVLAVIL